MNDYSFIRLEPTLEKAIYTRNSPVATIIKNDFVHLLPNETYLQTTSLKDGISFDGNYKVEIIDCLGAILKDITDNVAIEQFTDSNGIPQIHFEITNINADFYKKEVLFKFTHTVSDYVWYSNKLVITSYEANKTTRFDYIEYSETKVKSIRLACWFERNDAESESSEYININGIKTTSRLVRTEYEHYLFDAIDNFTYRRLNHLLTSPIIYVNGYRMTNKVVVQSDDRKFDTNYFALKLKLALNYQEEFSYIYQIFEDLNVIELFPVNTGYYTTDINTNFFVNFNRNISIFDATIRAKLYKEGVYVSETEITALDNKLEFNFGYTFTNGEYNIIIDANKVKSTIGEVWQGFNSSTDWTFTIAGAEYESTDYDNTEYLTN